MNDKQELEAALKHVHEHRTEEKVPGVLTNEISRLLETLGQAYKPAVCPPDVVRGPIGTCFDTCLVNVTFTHKYQYVEGKARVHPGEEWTYHSWLTDGQHAFDPTWKATDDTGEERAIRTAEYIGLPIPGAFVAYMNREADYAGVLGNRHRWPAMVDKMLKYRKEELNASRRP